jgi:hypothetical protein
MNPAPWVATLLLLGAAGAPNLHAVAEPGQTAGVASVPNDTAVGNLTAALNRLVTLVAAAGAGLLALVWARVAFSWFTNDVSKKIQAKERARDALVGTLLFVAALSGMIWTLAHWVLTGR